MYEGRQARKQVSRQASKMAVTQARRQTGRKQDENRSKVNFTKCNADDKDCGLWHFRFSSDDFESDEILQLRILHINKNYLD